MVVLLVLSFFSQVPVCCSFVFPFPVTAAYIVTSAALSSSPPTMSLNQWTPERKRATTINAVNAAIAPQTQRRSRCLLMRLRSCRIAAGITLAVMSVVDDG